MEEIFGNIMTLFFSVFLAFVAVGINSSCHFPIHQFPEYDTRIPRIPSFEDIMDAYRRDYAEENETSRKKLDSLIYKWESISLDIHLYHVSLRECSDYRLNDGEKQIRWFFSDFILYCAFGYVLYNGYNGMPQKYAVVGVFVVACAAFLFGFYCKDKKAESGRPVAAECCTSESFDEIYAYLDRIAGVWGKKSVVSKLADGIISERKSMTVACYIRLVFIVAFLLDLDIL